MLRSSMRAAIQACSRVPETASAATAGDLSALLRGSVLRRDRRGTRNRRRNRRGNSVQGASAAPRRAFDWRGDGMSAYEDTLLAARFAALAPEPLAGDWDDVLDRLGAARKGRRWPERLRVLQGRRRRLFVLLAVVALVAVVTASAFAVRVFVLDKGLVGLPPVGTTPSTPESGVREMYYWLHQGRERSANWVYADGRLIRRGAKRANGTPLRANRWSNGFVEQRLTREGVKLLRSEIVSAGGFGDVQPPPGSDPLVQGSRIEVRQGDQLVRLRWAKDLERLEARLAHPESWLPASA